METVPVEIPLAKKKTQKKAAKNIKTKTVNEDKGSPERKQTCIDKFCSPESKSMKESKFAQSEKLPPSSHDGSNAPLQAVKTRMVPSPTDIGFLKMSPFVDRKVKVERDGDNVDAIHQTPKAQKTKGKHNATKVKAAKNTKNTKTNSTPSYKLTDFYPVRRSSRKTKSLIKKEQEDEIINSILENCEDGLEVVEFKNKGRGVISTRNFSKGDFVVEYAGDLISWPDAREREQTYIQDSSVGCYMYYFNARGQNFCIDATAESGRLGRLLNHSRRNPNCFTRLVWVPSKGGKKPLPRLVIVAKRDLEAGEELVYDYGDRDKSALEVHPWLKS